MAVLIPNTKIVAEGVIQYMKRI